MTLLLALVLALVTNSTFKASANLSGPGPSPFAALFQQQGEALAKRPNATINLPLELTSNQLGMTRESLRLQGAITNDFSPPAQNWHSGHRGIDFAAKRGENVYSVVNGTVTFVGNVASKEVITITTKDGIKVAYEPVRASVRLGQPVVPGNKIGTVMPARGSHCTATCVHIGARSGQKYIDPWLFIKGWEQVKLIS